MDIHLDLDPSLSDRYAGDIGITLQLGRGRKSVELHAADLRIGRAFARVAGERRRARVEYHPERETISLHFEKILPAGHSRLEIAFSARLRGDLCGLYGAQAADRKFAFSQLAPTHARRFVPCFDEPSLKTRFRLAVTTGRDNAVLSNSRIEAEDLHNDGRKTVHFATTPLLSTYLLALAVGPIEASEAVMCGQTPIRVWHVPGHEGMAKFALGVARESLTRLERWFDLPYPYDKLDLVAVPDFEFGAMENPGAVFFRETLLLLDPSMATLAEQKRVAEVICHELAHMWYGDLVTMAWWDDLWLNEAFATWMAFTILDPWRPEWRIWQLFGHRRAAALDADALSNTHSIYTPVKSAAEATQNFDLITYEKGAAVIRMVERFLGAETFRSGVRLYIRRHRESNAIAADLWNALSEVSGQNVESIVRPWLEQEGHPVVSIRRAERDGLGVVELRQQRLWLHAKSTKKVSGKPARWPIPMVGRIGTGVAGETRLARHLLTSARQQIPAQGSNITFIYGNADEGGFYRPDHAPDIFCDLLDDIDQLTPMERQGLVDHQWALVRSGHATMASVLDLCARLGAEHDPDVLAAVGVPLRWLSRQLAPDVTPASEPKLRAWVEVYFGGQVDALGWHPAPGEDAHTRLRRAEILSIVGLVGHASSVLDEASLRCLQYLQDRGSLAPNLTDVVVSIAAMRGGPPLYDAFHRAMKSAPTPQEERRFLLALADFTRSDLIDRTLELCVGDEIAMQDVGSVLIRLFANRAARVPTWLFIQRRWSRLRKLIAPQLGGRLIAATPALGTPAYRREVAAFFRKNPMPASDRALRQALERFDWYRGFRGRAGDDLSDYLKG